LERNIPLLILLLAHLFAFSSLPRSRPLYKQANQPTNVPRFKMDRLPSHCHFNNMGMNSMDIVVAMEKFAAFRQQEDRFYACLDYLSPGHQALVSLEEIRSASTLALDRNERLLSSLPSEASSGDLTEVWRERICDWCYQVSSLPWFDKILVSICIKILITRLSFLHIYHTGCGSL
jgi:hypothetical protein